ncbi:hypothetical protein Tco_0448737 [Tanacetum coccineum]
MTRSSNKELFTPYEEPERVLLSTKKLFKTTSLDYSSSPKFDLFSNLEDQCEKEVTEAIGEPTMKEYVTITRIDYGSGSARPRIELKGRFLFELRDNAFSGTNGEDAVEHIDFFLKIVDSLNVNHDQLRISIFPFSLAEAASKWWKDESIGLITAWVDQTNFFFGKFYRPSRTGRKIETNGANNKVKWDPTNIELENWLASKFRNHETMDQYNRNTLWDYWKKGDDEVVITDNGLSNPRDDNLIEENKIA